MKQYLSGIKYLMFALLITGGLSFVSCGDKDDDGGNNGGNTKVDPSTIASANLVAYIPFNGNANEVKGNRTVTFKNVDATNYVAGQNGQAFQGKEGSSITYALSSNDKIAKAKGLTFSMWMKTPNVAPLSGAAAVAQINGTKGIGAFDAGGSFLFQLQDQGDLSTDSLNLKLYLTNSTAVWKGQDIAFSSTEFPANKWFHVVVMYNETTSDFRMYSNGKFLMSNVRFADGGDPQPLLGNLTFNGATKLFFGGWGDVIEGANPEAWQQFFKGAIDEVRIYDRGLTNEEVKALYNAEVTQLN